MFLRLISRPFCFFFKEISIYHPSGKQLYQRSSYVKEPSGIEKVRITTKDKIDLIGLVL